MPTTKKSAAKGSPTQGATAEPFPELRAAFTALQQEKATIVDAAAPLRAQRDAISSEIRALEKKEEALRQRIEAIEHPRLPQIDAQLSRLASAMGGRRMSDTASE